MQRRNLWLIGLLALNNLTFGAITPTVLPVPFGQYGDSVAVGPHNALVVWADYRRTEDLAHEIFGSRLEPLGELLDGDGIPLSGLASGGAAVAALGDQFLIVWAKGPNIYARRMRSSGELLDVRPIPIFENPAHPYPDLVYHTLSAAADGANFWVAWADDRHAPAGTPEYHRPSYQTVHAARIGRDGRVLDPGGLRIGRGRFGQEAPRLSRQGDFLVWLEGRAAGRAAIMGARLLPRGATPDPGGFRIMSTANINDFPFACDVAGNALGWLVVFNDASKIRAAHVARPRTVSRPFLIGTTAERTWAQVENCGPDYLVVWQSNATTLGAHVRRTGPLSRPFLIAGDSTGASHFSFGGIGGNGSRLSVIGTTAPRNATWMYNDVWLATFYKSAIR